MKTTEYENYLQSSIENKYHYTIISESKIYSKIKDILTVERFASIKIKKISSSNIELKSNIQLKRRKERQAQIQVMVPKVKKSINDIKADFKQKLYT